ncbi:MAG: hypothetical protein IJL20_12580 [Lachnospiraceae bacterium]|nr:hypothetical protein [Lachnospiraceae bacterium]
MRKNTDNTALVHDHLMKNSRSVILAEPWMIPSAMFISESVDYMMTHKIKHFIVIVQKKILEMEWLPLLKGAQNKNLTYAIAMNEVGRKLEAFHSGKQMILTNDESLDWILREVMPEDFCLVIDELSRYRHFKSKKYGVIRKLCSAAKGIIAFSRFPLPHGADEIWEEMFLIDKGARLGITKSAFDDRYFFVKRIQVGYCYKTIRETKKETFKAIGRAISDICLNLYEEKATDAKTIKKINTYVNLTYIEMSKYLLLKEHLSVCLRDGMKISASNENAASIKLLQLASGTVYDDDHNVLYFHERKIMKLKSIIEEYAGSNILVACWFKHEMERLKREIPGSVTISTKNDMERWNEGYIKIGIINASLGGNYMDMYKGGKVIIWFTLPWSLKLYNKTNERLMQEDGSDPVVINIIAKGTIDETVLQVLDVNKKESHGLRRHI